MLSPWFGLAFCVTSTIKERAIWRNYFRCFLIIVMKHFLTKIGAMAITHALLWLQEKDLHKTEIKTHLPNDILLYPACKIKFIIITYGWNIYDMALKSSYQSIIILWEGGTGAPLQIVTYLKHQIIFFQQHTTQQTNTANQIKTKMLDGNSVCQQHVY